jgi:hypothetical protein
MGDTTTPGVIVIPEHTVTNKQIITTVSSNTITQSGAPTTIISSTTFITTATTTNTSIPTDGIFIGTTVEIFAFVIFIVLIVTNVATLLQFKRIRGKQDKSKDIEQVLSRLNASVNTE